jgi:hypothetical protein
MPIAEVPTHDGPGAGPGTGAGRYGVVLALLAATFLFLASDPTGRWVPLAAVGLEGATLLAALAAARAGRRFWGLAAVALIAAAIAGVAALASGRRDAGAAAALLSALLVGMAPVAIARDALHRRRVDPQSVLAVLCIYVMAGMAWAFLYRTIDEVERRPFFQQRVEATLGDHLYFSFVTLTTVGYGDLTPIGAPARALAVLEALSGQLYLVTVVALVVSRMTAPRRS